MTGAEPAGSTKRLADLHNNGKLNGYKKKSTLF